MYALQTRLNVLLGVSLVVMFSLHAVLVGGFPRYLTEDYAVSRLEHDATSVLSRVAFGPDGGPLLTPGPISPIYRTAFSGHYFRVETEGKVLRSRSLWDEDLAVPTMPPGGTEIIRREGPMQRPLLVWAGGFRKGGHALTIAVAEDMTEIDARIFQFQLAYLLGLLATAAVLLIAQRLIVRHSLRPVEQARSDCLRLERGEVQSINERVPLEIQPLVVEINRLLRAMRQRIERSRNALGNLAHAIKTPLSVLRQLQDHPGFAQHPADRDTLALQVSAIHQIVERELKRARMAGRALPGQRLRLEQEITGLLEVLERIYGDKRLQLEHRIPAGKSYTADREDMFELFGNLLDNACKWAHTQARLTIEATPGLEFRVEDDGPGAPLDAIEQLVRRGARADETMPGHGLGLSIVADIVAQYGGDIQFARSATLGGLSVHVRLPPPEQREATN